VTDPAPLEALPDLTLAEAGVRWGVSSRYSVKARVAALGVLLRRESSTRTFWPAQSRESILQRALKGCPKWAPDPGCFTASVPTDNALPDGS
jgi:hypothetical protein